MKTYSEVDFIINMIISSYGTINSAIISDKLKFYFNEVVEISYIDNYMLNLNQNVETNKFSLQMKQIF